MIYLLSDSDERMANCDDIGMIVEGFKEYREVGK